MAPNRRKGANRAAAAAAARRKWKVGDLVLAKVKGFPAWPATVSEPEKWGYPADRKKVFVFFFGTEQIAFCNPADVEEFTEEKKGSLLGKRHGKGADFVRAVNEIIDCFEKLKKQDQVSRPTGDEETNITNRNNSEESLTKSVKDVAPVVTYNPLSAMTAHDLNSLTEAAVAAAAEDALHDEKMQLVEAPSSSMFMRTPVSTTSLTENKTEASRSRNTGSKGRKSARILSSSRNDASRPRSTVLPSINKGRSSRRLGVNDRSLRSGRIIKSSDDSEGQDADSIEDSDSEMIVDDSDMHSVDDGRTTNSGSKPVGVEAPFSENNEDETELSDRLDFQSQNIIIKKKRKPNRKRHNIDIVETAKLDIVASDVEVLKIECVSPSCSEKSAERYAKDDGDEHLPLVKRARVRMGRPSPEAEEEVTLLNKEEYKMEVPESLSVLPSEHLGCKVDVPADMESGPIKEDPALSSFSHASPITQPHLWETRKNRVDVEAALPPSKRLHRALEAMSANVAEDSERASNCSPATNIQSNGYGPSSFMENSELSRETESAIESESGAVEYLSNGNSLLSASEFCTVSDMEVSGDDAKAISVVSNCGSTHGIVCTNPELRRDSFDHEVVDNNRLKLSSLNEDPAEDDVDCHSKLDSLNVGEQLPNLHYNTPSLSRSPVDCCKTEFPKLDESATGSDPCIPLDSVKDEGAETHKLKHLQLDENNQDSNRSEFVEEARPESLDSNIMLSVTPVKVLNNGHQQSLIQSTSISHDHMDDRTVSVSQSSSSLTDGPYSIARASPPSSSICNITALDNHKSLENSNSCSPNVQLHLEKVKLAGKYSSKVESLSSFEAVIRSLTRTKESIGRATRIAIDSAKLGFATKVVDILARNLESEASLHKKVDLFFLVDSITQCSRGIKGDGGIYPSAIQALLPRLLLAAAPPGSSSRENHRQCLKVLRVWQERKIMPEPIIRHHIRELDALCGSYPTIGSNRTSRGERAFDDPIREMEGMQVDEYGSNSSIQLPGFCMPPMLRDDDGRSDSDEESFEAVTPEHDFEKRDGEKTLFHEVEKRSHILEDVDGELEMEDVAPSCEVEEITGADHTQMSHYPSDNQYRGSFTPQRPKDVPLMSAPLPRSSQPAPPPRPPRPLPPPVCPPAVLNSVSNGPESKPYSNSQTMNRNLAPNQSVFPRVKPVARDALHHRVRENKDLEAQLPRQVPGSSRACQSTSRLSGRASNNVHPADAYSKGFHLHPPHPPAPSNQFSYIQEQRIHSRRDIPPPSHPNRFHTRNSEDGNFYRDRDRNKFLRRDNIGECWRAPFPPLSGPCYPDDARMDHAPMSYNGPQREPALANNKWDYPSRPMNHRHFNPCRPPSKGPFPVTNRGPNFWRPR